MPITQLNQLQIAYKKLLGKSHVSPNRTEVSELIPSFVQSANSTVFGQTLPSGSQIPINQTANLYQTSSGGIVELVRFELTKLSDGDYTPSNGSVSGTTIDDQAENTADGAHGYALRISGSYNTRSNNPRKNTGLFTGGGSLTGSAGSLQLVPPAYDSRYAAKAYQSNGTEIFGSNAIEWSLDYASGVLFVQDYDASVIPTFVDAFLYIGKYTNEVVADLSASLQSVAGTNAYATMSVGGVAVIADNATGTLTIASGSFGGAATTNNNLLISASAGNDTITFSLVDSPRFTHITASGNISSSGNLTVTGTSTLTGRLTANGAITTTNVTASGNISASGNLVINQITASGLPQTAPDSRQILMIDPTTGTIVRVIAAELSGSVGVGSFKTISIGGLGNSSGTVTADSSTDTLNISSSDVNLTITATENGTIDTLSFDFADSPIFTHITASGNISASGNIIVTGDIAVNGGDITTNQANFNLLAGATGTLTIGAVATNVTIPGNLIVNGDTTVINTSTLSIEDKFIVLGRSSGSEGPASEGGIIIEGAAGSGSAFVFNSGSGANVSNRWGIAVGVPTGSSDVTPTDFMVSVSSSGAAPSTAPTYGGANGGFGNMYVQSDGEIWIYS